MFIAGSLIIVLFRTALWWKTTPDLIPAVPTASPTEQDSHDAAWVICGLTNHPAWIFENPRHSNENRLRTHFFNDTAIYDPQAIFADFPFRLPAKTIIRHLLSPETIFRLHNFGNETNMDILASTSLEQKPMVHKKQGILFANRWARRKRHVSLLYSEFWFPYITRSYLDGLQGFTFAVRPTGPDSTANPPQGGFSFDAPLGRPSRVFVLYSYRPFYKGPFARLCTRLLVWWTMMDLRRQLFAAASPPPHDLGLRYDAVAEFLASSSTV